MARESVGNRVFGAAALVTVLGLLGSCNLAVDGLASSAVEEDSGFPVRPGSVPPLMDAGAVSSASAPPVVMPPDAGAPPVTPADAGVVAPVTPPAVTPPMPPVTPPPAPVVVRARDVKVKRLMAGTIYVHKLEAKTGTAGSVTIHPDPVVDLDLGPKNLEVDELVVDTLYAHDVHAEHVQITETHAAEVKIGTKGAD